MTNGDKIRQMSDEELARLIGENVLCSECPAFNPEEVCGRTPSECCTVWLDWLRMEVLMDERQIDGQ